MISHHQKFCAVDVVDIIQSVNIHSVHQFLILLSVLLIDDDDMMDWNDDGLVVLMETTFYFQMFWWCITTIITITESCCCRSLRWRVRLWLGCGISWYWWWCIHPWHLFHLISRWFEERRRWWWYFGQFWGKQERKIVHFPYS